MQKQLRGVVNAGGNDPHNPVIFPSLTAALGYCCAWRFFHFFHNNRQIATRLGVGESTVRRHRAIQDSYRCPRCSTHLFCTGCLTALRTGVPVPTVNHVASALSAIVPPAPLDSQPLVFPWPPAGGESPLE